MYLHRLPFAIVLALLIILADRPAWAVGQAAVNPQAIIEDVSNKIQARMQDQKFTQDFRQVTDFVSSVIEPHADFDLFSMLVLGKYWKNAAPSEQARFKQEFKTLLIRVYSRAFVEFKQWTIKFSSVAQGSDESRVLVRTQVVQSTGQPVDVDYRMLFGQGGWKVYDILIDGVSLVTNYRTSFRADIENAGGSLASVIKDLNKRNQEALSGGEPVGR